MFPFPSPLLEGFGGADEVLEPERVLVLELEEGVVLVLVDVLEVLEPLVEDVEATHAFVSLPQVNRRDVPTLGSERLRGDRVKRATFLGVDRCVSVRCYPFRHSVTLTVTSMNAHAGTAVSEEMVSG